MNMELKNAVEAAAAKAQYDTSAKRLLGQKSILAQYQWNPDLQTVKWNRAAGGLLVSIRKMEKSTRVWCDLTPFLCAHERWLITDYH